MAGTGPLIRFWRHRVISFIGASLPIHERSSLEGRGAGRRLHRALLESMGLDLGAIHAGQKRHVDEIRRDLKKRPAGWLAAASHSAAKQVRREYKSWRQTYREKR
jgi:hypothetical protein